MEIKGKKHNSNNKNTKKYTTITTDFSFCFSFCFFFCILWQLIVSAEVRVKRQDDDDSEVNVEELCQDRAPDEYFRLSADGDCRDVVR